jgi:hypothetical protein
VAQVSHRKIGEVEESLMTANTITLGQGEYGRSLLRATESFMICCVFVNVQLHEYRVRVVVGTLP